MHLSIPLFLVLSVASSAAAVAIPDQALAQRGGWGPLGGTFQAHSERGTTGPNGGGPDSRRSTTYERREDILQRGGTGPNGGNSW